jgi:putative ABC transport system permease protein
MSYFHLIWVGLWRNKIRTTFTALSIIVAFLLFGMLQGLNTAFNQLVDRGRLNVLVTRSPAGLPLPLADLSQIQRLQGVTQVTYQSLFVGSYQSPRNFVAVLAVDAVSFLAQNSTYEVSPAEREAFLRTRDGVLVAQSLAKKFAWKVGDRIPIHAFDGQKKDGAADWTFQVVGTFGIADSPGGGTPPILLMNYSYFDAARANDAGTVLVYQETIVDASQAAAVGTAIDSLFANSSNPTKTATERENAQGALAQIGDFDFFVEVIVAATFATLLLLTSTTLMQAYRDRTHEFAVMKTLGFTDRGIATLVLSEGMLLTVGAAVLGLLLADAVLGKLGSVTASAVGARLRVPWIVSVIGVGFAVLLALVSAVPPAWRAQRLSIVAALAVR